MQWPPLRLEGSDHSLQSIVIVLTVKVRPLMLLQLPLEGLAVVE
jgi:hypothetical protein